MAAVQDTDTDTDMPDNVCAPLQICFGILTARQGLGRAWKFVIEASTKRSAISTDKHTMPFAVLSTMDAFSAILCAEVHLKLRRQTALTPEEQLKL